MHTEITKRFVKKVVNAHKKEILAIGVYGSVSEGAATKYSDIDLLVVTRGLAGHKYFLSGKTPVMFYFESEASVRSRVATVNSEWPAAIADVMGTKTVYGDVSVFENFKQLARIAKNRKKEFNRAAEEAKMEVYEYILKLNSAAEQKDFGKATEAIWNIIHHSENLVALRNREYFRKPGFRALDEVKRFKKLPAGYVKAIDFLWKSRSLPAIRREANKLWQTLKEF